MTARSGQGRRSAADADADRTPLRASRPLRPEDAAAQSWAERLASLPDDAGLGREPPPPDDAPVADRPPLPVPTPPNRPWRRFLIGVTIVGGLSALNHAVQLPPAAQQETAPVPDSPAAADPSLPHRAVAAAKPATAPGVDILPNGNSAIAYDSIPDDWTPDLAALTVNSPGDFYGSVRAPKIGFLSEFSIVHFDSRSDLGSIDGHPDTVRDQMLRDYAAIVHQNAAVLTCSYATGPERSRSFKYWYRIRPAQADPEYARDVASDNPLLKIASPQNNCPPNQLRAQWASDVPVPKPYDFSRDDPGSPNWDPHKGVWH